MVRAHGYSLWLMPAGAAYDCLADITGQLSREYSTPTFEPHVTLIGGLVGPEGKLAAQTAELAAVTPRLELELTTTGFEEEYFRCLFIRVDPTEVLREANRRARRIFGRENDSEYQPHLSLVYGNLSTEVKQRIVAGIGSRFDLTFLAPSLHLMSTEGEPGEWRRVTEMPLG